MLATLCLAALAPAQFPLTAVPVDPGRPAFRPPVVTDLALAAVGRVEVTGDGRFLGFFVGEVGQGGLDLNGDGDAVDVVFHFLEIATGSVTNSGFQGSWQSLVAGPDRFGWRIHETLQGSDLNGDGDLLDALTVVLEPGRSPAFVALTGNLAFADAPWAALNVSEAGVDLNGNGSTRDRVLFAWNTESGAIGVIGPPALDLEPLTSGPAILFIAGEDGLDLNGDGDLDDAILHVWESGTGLLQATPFAVSDLPMVGGGLEAIPVSESGQSVDLDGDGDTADTVLYVFHRPTYTVQPTGRAYRGDFISFGHGGFAGSLVSFGGDHVAFSVHEGSQGEDLDGNGLLLGSVLHVHDALAGTTTNLGLTVWQHEITGGHVVFEVPEGRHAADLNGDGDTSDYVLHLHSLATGVTLNLGLTTQVDRQRKFQARGGWAAFEVSEGDQGGSLNGDNDLQDEVLHVCDVSTGRVTNTGLTAREFELGGRALFFTLNEADPPVSDLNGDGDTLDHLLFGWDLVRSRRVPTGLALDPTLPVFGVRGSLGFALVSEVHAGVDLNGDGDALDGSVLHTIELRP